MIRPNEELEPTADAEAERAVLGSVLLLPQVLDDLTLELSPGDFLDSEYGEIYRHMQAVHESGKYVDPKLIYESMRRAGSATDRLVPTLAECANSVFTAANAAHYARMVRDRAIRRSIYDTGRAIIEAGRAIDDGALAVNRCEELAFAIRDKHRCGVERIQTSSQLLESAMRELESREAGSARLEWHTGFDDLDRLMAMRPAEMVILAARPSMGKSALALNIATKLAVWEQVLFVSLEMSSTQLADRVIASESQVDGHRLKGSLSPSERTRVIEAASSLSQLKLSIDDSPTRNVTEIAAVARRAKRKTGLSLLVVDYLQLIVPENSRDSREQQVAQMSRRLKAIARELNICVLCLAQLNRQNETAGNRLPTLSNLRESGAIEQDADVVMFIHREDYYLTPEEAETKNLKGIAQILVRKQRQGPVGAAKLLWQPPFTRFVPLADRRYDDVTGPDAF